MNKKFLTLLTLTFVLGSSTAYAFSDTENHWAKDTINKAKEMNIINGYENDMFMPDNNMTRAELVTVVNRLLGLESESDKYIPDIARQDWFHSDIRKAVAMGILQGDEFGNVKPNDYVTREQAVLILSRALKVENNSVIKPTSYLDDNDISAWARDEVITFVSKNYITGYENNTIKPKENITRAEVLTILNRIVSENIIENVANKKIGGTALVKGKNITLANVEIFGDLIIGEATAKTISLRNVTINGDLILYGSLLSNDNTYTVKGTTFNMYNQKINSNLYYENKEYGIKIALPDGASAIDYNPNKTTNKDLQDTIIIQITKDDEYYFEDIAEISTKEISKLKTDSIFKKLEVGEIQGYPYILYKDNAKSHLLYIKRDNVVYGMLFINIVSDNILDNTIANIEFAEGEQIESHKDVIYKNSKLSLKFTYKEGYVGVDDSYNTGVIYSGDSIFKLFIQVNSITDISDYSLSEIKTLLRTLNTSDGKIVSESVGKVADHDSIRFEIVSEDSKIISLYVIIGNNLYNFIFKGETSEVESIGNEVFADIVSSIEF